MPSLVEAGYTVIAPDLRGLGDSSAPDTGYDSVTVAEDIHQLMQSLGIKKVHLVGHDIGTGPADAQAATYSDEIVSLTILEGAPVGIEPMPVADGDATVGQTRDSGAYWHMGMQAAAPDLAATLIAGQEREYIDYFFKTYAADPTAVTEAEINMYAAAYARPGAMRTAFRYYEAMATQNVMDNQRLSQTPLSMPVLALGGEDVIGDGVLRIMQRLGPDVQSGVVLDAGHWLMSEQPGEMSTRLIAFLDSTAQ